MHKESGSKHRIPTPGVLFFFEKCISAAPYHSKKIEKGLFLVVKVVETGKLWVSALKIGLQ